MEHRTRRLDLSIEVDEAVYDMVQWINSLHWTYTMDSCQGYGGERKWVTFTCLHHGSYSQLWAKAYEIEGEIVQEEIMGSIRYCLRW